MCYHFFQNIFKKPSQSFPAIKAPHSGVKRGGDRSDRKFEFGVDRFKSILKIFSLIFEEIDDAADDHDQQRENFSDCREIVQPTLKQFSTKWVNPIFKFWRSEAKLYVKILKF